MAKSPRGLTTIGVLDPRLTFDGRDTATISATEASPRPGTAEADDDRATLYPSILGGQDTDVDLYVSKGGFPSSGGNADQYGGIESSGCSVLYKRDAATAWRGYSGGTVLRDVKPIKFGVAGAGAEYRRHDCFSIPDTGRLIVLAAQTNTGAGDAFTCTYLDPLDSTATEVSIRAWTTPEDWWAVTGLVLPSGRLLAILEMSPGGSGTTSYLYSYYSDDDGATWTEYSKRISTGDSPNYGSSDTVRLRCCMVGDQIVLVRLYYDHLTADNIDQYVSSDLGATWQVIDRTTAGGTAGYPHSHSLVASPDGEVIMTYIDYDAMGTEYIYIKRVGSAYSVIWDQDEETVASVNTAAGTFEACSCHRSDQGRLHLYWTYKLSTNVAFMIYNFSDDFGDNWLHSTTGWSAALRPATTATANEYPGEFSSCHAYGQEVLVTHFYSATAGVIDENLAAWFWGGWSEYGLAESLETVATAYIGLLPWVEPGVFTGVWGGTSGGAWTYTRVNNTDAYIRNTTAASNKYVFDSFGAFEYNLIAEGCVKNSSGTAAWDSLHQGVWLQAGNGANYRWAKMGFGGNDNKVGISLHTGVDYEHAWSWASKGWYHFRIFLDADNGLLHWFYKGDTDEEWTQHADSPIAIATAAAALGSYIQIGSLAGGTQTTDWRYFRFYVNTDAEPVYEQTTLRGIQVATEGFTLPGIGPDDRIARLALYGGPAQTGEGYDIDHSADYPISACYPDVSPSPGVMWRSTSNAEQTPMAWDLDYDTSLGNATLIVGMLGCNFSTAIVEGWDGVAWNTVGQIDFYRDFDSVGCSLNGDCLVPGTTGTNGKRYLWMDELTGGWAYIDAGAGTEKRRKIRRSTEGMWQCGSAMATRRPTIWLDGMDGTEPAATSCTLYSSNAVGVFHNVTSYEKYRLRIPAGINADGYFRIGAAGIWGAHVLGKQHSLGWSWSRSLNAEVQRSRSGTSYSRRLGPAPRSLTMAWTEGMDHTMLHLGAPDTLQAQSGQPLAAAEDVGWLLTGIVEQAKSGEVPLLVIPNLPKHSCTITDPTQFLYCRIASDVTLNHALGTEGTEVYRVGNVTFEEIV